MSRVRRSAYRQPVTPKGLEAIEKGTLQWFDTEMYSNLSKEFKTLVAVISGVSNEIPIHNQKLAHLHETWCDTPPDEEKF